MRSSRAFQPELILPSHPSSGERISTTLDRIRSTTLSDRYASRYFCSRPVASSGFLASRLFSCANLLHFVSLSARLLLRSLLRRLQILLARRLGKTCIIAETGAGQHGVATATACAKFGLKCKIYMGAEDVRRQALNVFRIKMLGAEVRRVSSSFSFPFLAHFFAEPDTTLHAYLELTSARRSQVVPVTSGSQTLKDAINQAMRDWVVDLPTTHYCVGSAIGPHPFPTIVRDFQRVIGKEIKSQLQALKGKLPDAVVACVGGGSNAIGTFYDFIPEKSVRLIGVEAGGDGEWFLICPLGAVPTARSLTTVFFPLLSFQESRPTDTRPPSPLESLESFTESRPTSFSPRTDRSSRLTQSRLDSTTLFVSFSSPFLTFALPLTRFTDLRLLIPYSFGITGSRTRALLVEGHRTSRVHGC